MEIATAQITSEQINDFFKTYENRFNNSLVNNEPDVKGTVIRLHNGR